MEEGRVATKMIKILIDERGIFVSDVNRWAAYDEQWECSSLLTAIRALTHSDRMQITKLNMPPAQSTVPKEMLCDWGVEEFLKPGTVRTLEPLPRAQWEYRCERLDDYRSPTRLNRLGNEGWEACFRVDELVYFKRLRGWQAQTDTIQITDPGIPVEMDIDHARFSNRCGACISPSPSDQGPYQCIHDDGHDGAHLTYPPVGPPITF